MKFLKYLKNDNKAGDVGLTGMILIMCALMLSTMALDLFANAISKQYVIEKMQAAESYALTVAYEPENSNECELYINVKKAKTEYLNFIDNYLKLGNTVFETLDFSYPNCEIINSDTLAYLEAFVTYTPHQFIRDPSDILQPGISKNSYKTRVRVQTIITVYDSTGRGAC